MSNVSRAQQDPMYTQYNFNTQTINPAYAGTWENMGFVVLGRHQWVGMDGAPRTYTFSMQSGTKNENVGLGFNIISDQIGKEQRLSLFGDYSYRLRLTHKSYLRLGLKFGVTNYSNNLSAYQQYPGEIDPASQGDINMSFMPNAGLGAFLYSKKYYIGLSIPKLIENQYKNDYNNYSVQAEMRHFFLIAGYVFDISNDVKFKPTFLTKATFGAPVELDFTASFLLKEKVWLGAMYRTGDSFGFIAQWIFDNNLRVGYSIDFTTSKLQQFHNGTHEIMVSYEIGLKRKWTTPRMF
ncbi:MAG: type IX secretion system membrane protein PorP/SprF [Draconibacterium sp.]|nr:type IX secretion system membrane protein PorP/SprF [Draconibacterium sp.]